MGWNDVTEGGGGDYLKLKAGEKVRVHVLLADGEEPFTHFSIYNKEIKKGARVAEDYVPTGALKKRKQHAVNVFDLNASVVKVWVMSNTTAMELKNLFEQNGSLEGHDLIIKRTGTELETKYSVQPAMDGCQYDPSFIEGVTLPDLPTILAVESDERIAAVEAGLDPDDGEPAAEDAPAEAPAEDAPAEPSDSAEDTPAEEEQPAPPPARKPAPPAKPAPGKPAPAKPAPGKAAPAPTANGADAAKKANLIKVILQKKATKAKFKDPKAWSAVLLAATKSAAAPKGKSVLSALSIQELTKLDSLIK